MQTLEEIERQIRRNPDAYRRYNYKYRKFIERRVQRYGETRKQARRLWVLKVTANPWRFGA